MGLLDDAIREHLELKRLRGADPGEVAREENAALGPPRRQDEPTLDTSREDHTEPVAPEGPDPGALDPPQNSSSEGQETVEINMEAELAGSSDSGRAESSDVRVEPVVHPAHGQPSSGDSLEWEVPGDRRPESSAPHDDGPKGDDGPAPDQSVDDVLEETPDFLRDTPEQERLWFEQRPPRDFDFNE